VSLSKRFEEKKNTLLPLTRIKTRIIQASGFQSVLCESQGMQERFPEDSWIHFCNGCYEFYLFLNNRNKDLLKIIAKLLEMAICLIRTTVRIPG
jgi:hypothetical protein